MANILVIEDNEQNLYLTTFILERLSLARGRQGLGGWTFARPPRAWS